MSFLITGCGRSGTAFYSKVVSAAGLPCYHEGFFNWDDTKNRKNIEKFLGSPAGESSWYAVPYLNELTGVPVVHVVRHPKAVAASFYKIGLLSNSRRIHTTKGTGWVEYVRRNRNDLRVILHRMILVAKHRQFLKMYTSCFDIASESQRLYHYWYSWNKIIEDRCAELQLPYLRVHVEDSAQNAPAVLEFLGIKSAFPQLNVSRNEKNKYRKRTFPDDKPIQPNVLDMMRRYGYLTD